MRTFLRHLTCRNADGDTPLGMALCAVVFVVCLALLMQMPGY